MKIFSRSYNIVISIMLALFIVFLPLSFSNAKNILNKSNKSQHTTQSTIKAEPKVNVGIILNTTSVKISATDEYSIEEISNKYSYNKEISITNKDGMVAVDGKSTKKKQINIKLKNKSDKTIKVNNKEYRGDIKIVAEGKNLTVINNILLEQYLYGVIKNEMSPEWSIEAVKAQAVAARTYAINQIDANHKNSGFDVCATTHCQVYSGKSAETSRAIQAVDETKGIVIKYKGSPITAYYHSSSGGYTENSENVWVSSVPYLKGVVDYDQNSPNYKWEKSFTATDFNKKLKDAGYNIGSLKKIQLSSLKTPPVKAEDRGVSGRVKKVEITGTSGKATIDGSTMRNIFGLNSALFDMKISKGGVIFTGRGLGHGVGMSQWGAKAMAEKASDKEKDYYQKILKHYYKDVDIEKLY